MSKDDAEGYCGSIPPPIGVCAKRVRCESLEKCQKEGRIEIANKRAKKIYSLQEQMEAMEAEIDTLTAEVERLREALRPFAHPDLCKQVSGNKQGDDSPVFGRDKATLTLGDFRRARAALEDV